MNKQEAIKGIESEKILGFTTTYEDERYNEGLITAKGYIEQIDVPEKVVVPQCVADWYEEHKDKLSEGIGDFYINFDNDCFGPYAPELTSGFVRWFDVNYDTAIETLVKMKLFGYEIKKEKKYTVEIPNPNGDKYSKSYDDGYKGYTKTYLGKNEDGKVELVTWRFELRKESDYWKRKEDAQLTEKEIKEDYAWAWDLGFAKEVKE